MRRRVLITGASGMVGSHLIDYILDTTDWQVFGLLRWRSPLDNLRQHLKQANSPSTGRVEFLYGDLRDEIGLREVVRASKPDFTFHLAAQSFPQTSFSSPIDTFDTNILGTYRLLQSLVELCPQSKVLVCSSSEVFGRVPRNFVPIKEDCRFHPASPYAISKVGTDLIGRFFFEAYGLNTQTTRMFTHTGPRRGDVFAESTFAKQIAMIEHGLSAPVVQVGNLDSMRTFADVRDAVRAYCLLLGSDRSPPGSVYNIGGSYSCSVGEMLDYLIGLSTYNGQIEIRIDQSRIRPIDADLQIPDTTLFKEVTGWEPVFTFEQTMADLLNYWRTRVGREGIFLTR